MFFLAGPGSAGALACIHVLQQCTCLHVSEISACIHASHSVTPDSQMLERLYADKCTLVSFEPVFDISTAMLTHAYATMVTLVTMVTMVTERWYAHASAHCCYFSLLRFLTRFACFAQQVTLSLPAGHSPPLLLRPGHAVLYPDPLHAESIPA